MKFTNEFKVALSQLPSKEKDRLLWQLIKRDKLLAQRLEYELLAPYNAIDKRELLAQRIKLVIPTYINGRKRLSTVLSQIRSFSGDITRHVYITKDRVGEITLNFILLRMALLIFENEWYALRGRINQKYMSYLTNKLYRTCMLVLKLHQDFYIEIEDDAHELGEAIKESPAFADYLQEHNFSVNWLLELDIPDNLDAIYKAVK